MKLLIAVMLLCLSSGVQANIPGTSDIYRIIPPNLSKDFGTRLAERDLQMCNARAELGYQVSMVAHQIPMKTQITELAFAIFTAPKGTYSIGDIVTFRNIIITAYSKTARANPIRYGNYLWSDCMIEKKIFVASK